MEEEPRLESRPRWPVGEVTDEEVVVVVVEEVVEELRSSCLLPKEPLWRGRGDKQQSQQEREPWENCVCVCVCVLYDSLV